MVVLCGYALLATMPENYDIVLKLCTSKKLCGKI
jgi:hypothetical protein